MKIQKLDHRVTMMNGSVTCYGRKEPMNGKS